MRTKKMERKKNYFFCVLLMTAFIALIPNKSRAADLSYGGWELDGFFRNNTGVWMESWDYTHSNDPLATCRNWFRLNLNGSPTDKISLKAEVLAVYEPEYKREEGAGIPANFYNYFDFRELRLDWKPISNHSFRLGRQIVNWGESISARVGDVVNPVDGRWDLGFTNLEDTRMPIWMIRGLHFLPSIYSSVDWIFSPYMQPDRYRVNRGVSFGMGSFLADGTWLGTPAGRFAPAPDFRFFGSDGRQYGANEVLTINPATLSFVPAPVLIPPGNTIYQQLSAGTDLGPLLGLPAGLLVTPTDGYYLLSEPRLLTTEYPGSGLDDSRYGFKTSTTLGGYQTGIYYWRAHAFSPVFYKRGPIDFQIVYDRQNTFGFYANKNFSFGILRMDVAYKPDTDYQTLDEEKHPALVTEIDTLLFQIGLNKEFWIKPVNQNQVISLTAEYVGEYLLTGDADRALVAPVYYNRKPRDSHTLMASIDTNYNFGMYKYALTCIYNLKNNGLIQPAFIYTPTWMNNSWTFKLQYTNIFGDNDLDYPYGLARNKDLVVLTTQFSF